MTTVELPFLHRIQSETILWVPPTEYRIRIFCIETLGIIVPSHHDLQEQENDDLKQADGSYRHINLDSDWLVCHQLVVVVWRQGKNYLGYPAILSSRKPAALTELPLPRTGLLHFIYPSTSHYSPTSAPHTTSHDTDHSNPTHSLKCESLKTTAPSTIPGITSRSRTGANTARGTPSQAMSSL
jgi:hypothetical protein